MNILLYNVIYTVYIFFLHGQNCVYKIYIIYMHTWWFIDFSYLWWYNSIVSWTHTNKRCYQYSIYSNSINQTYNILNNNCKTFYCVTLCHSSCCFISFYFTILHCSNFNCVADCDSQPTNICKLVASAGFARVMNIMNPWHVSTHETKIEELIPNNKTSTWSLNDKNMRSWLIITLMLGYKSNRFQEGLIKYINISRIHLLQPFNKKGSKCRGGKRQVLKLLMGMTWKRRFHVVSLGSTSQTPAKMYPNNTLKTNICDSRGKHESISFPFGVIDILECISKKKISKLNPNQSITK